MASLIEDLSKPESLPDRTGSVRVVQTHISIVFVADRFVYKVKKPVNFGFLDFTTLERRLHFCQEEVRLNRRLSKDLYVDVLPVTFDGTRYSLAEGGGRVVEYAVKMRRIPESRLMKAVFERGELTENHLKGLARVLARFHGSAQRDPGIDRFGEAERFKINTDENFVQVEKYRGLTIETDVFEDLKAWTGGFYRRHGNLFEERIAGGRIRDCHGDLHMEHICLTEDFPIFDCIEFNERFRYGDTLADIAFLLMDLDFHGGSAFSALLWEHYRQTSGEGGVEALLTFYKVYRAFVRGKVIGFQLDDGGIGDSEKEKAVSTAGKYFQLAHSYIVK